MPRRGDPENRLTRRTALTGMAGLVLGFYLPSGRASAQSGAAQVFAPDRSTPTLAPNAFVRIGADDWVTVLIKHIEFGQGPMTGLATLVAEELDADWSRVRAEHAPSNPDLYKNLAFGMQGTGGSTAIANSYEQMRSAGAAARIMLVQAAARTWGVSPDEITVERGVLRHTRSGRNGRFGQFAEAAAKLPVPSLVQVKDPARFRLIGREGVVTRLDSAAKANGTAQFTMDIREPGMLTVLVARPPRFGGKLVAFEADAARAVRGVVDVKEIPSGVAVFAEGMWPALKGREKLRTTWDEAGAEKRSSDDLVEEYLALSRKPGTVAGQRGNAAAVLRGEGVIEAEYVFPYLAHAPMEPLDGFLRWDGKRAQARLGSQLQTGDHQAIAAVLGLKPDAVEVETMLAGGSFGRRAQPDMQLAVELAHAAKAIGPGRPIKLVWTREDDLRGGYYRPLFVHRMRGAVREGKILAWSNTIVGQSFLKGSPFAAMIKDGIDPVMVEGARELPYDIADFRCDLHTVDVGVPTLWWRSVGHTHTAYAVECFIDELLQAAGQDPVVGRLALLEKRPRYAAVLNAVARLARWNGPGAGDDRARGAAIVESFGSIVAQIAEVSAGGREGPRVHRVWCAIDCGIAVNPDVIRAQMEGGIGFGLGHALYGELTLQEGRPVQGNFNDYRSLRITEMPQVEVMIMRSTEKPTGVGEPGVPPIGPAVANALARLGLPRPRRLPMLRSLSA